MRRLALWCAAALCVGSTVHAAPPEGFVAEVVREGWEELVGVAPLDDGRLLAWERGGRLWMLDIDGTRLDPPLLDIHDEVGGWRDHGLLSVAPHPNFLQNGEFFLFYVVDRHHLMFAGTPEYDPEENWYFAASIARLTRYTAEAATNFLTVDPSSRTVLIGDSPTTGFPIVHQSHAVGSLVFGDDGTLLLSFGDSASYEAVDLGGQLSGGYVTQAIADGILRPKEDIGSFRAQLVDSLCGKVLRIDPDSGHGLASNPFFDPREPASARSRVWCLGLRNPFRMQLEPETGSHNPEDGDPGTLMIADVGWTDWEEWNRAESGGLNFGWPIFEGLRHLSSYAKADVANLDAPNAGSGSSCDEPWLRFRTLLMQDTQRLPVFWNPCAMMQAENAELAGAESSDASAGYHGDGYAVFVRASDGQMRWAAEVPPEGSELIGIRYASSAGSAAVNLVIDAVESRAPVLLPSTELSTEWRVVEVPIALSPGAHTIELRSIGQGTPAIDGIAVYRADAPPVLAADAPAFLHTRPRLEWYHWDAIARVPGFVNGAATTVLIGGAGSPVAGESFSGQCGIGGTIHHFASWPEAWHGKVFVADFTSSWLRALTLDDAGDLAEVSMFDAEVGSLTAIVPRSWDESLWAVRWPGTLLRIAYEPGGDQPPVVVLSSSKPWGPSPLEVAFDASASSDPERGPLAFDWDFGDGTSGQGSLIRHSFVGEDGPHMFVVTCTATDQAGGSTSKELIVSVNNSPPSVRITSLVDGQLFPMDAKTVFPLEAEITDAEHGADELTCAWQTILHHNTHSHPEPTDSACVTETIITPVGCGAETFLYEVVLTVEDAAGLSTTSSVMLYPDCDGVLACMADLDNDGMVGSSDLAILLGAWGSNSGEMDFDGDGVTGAAEFAVLLGNWGPC